jgi:hypothetical protein
MQLDSAVTKSSKPAGRSAWRTSTFPVSGSTCGWWQGSIDDLICDAICRQRCIEAAVVVVAVDYRLAPEHPFPTPLDDAYAAYSWVAANADALGINANNVSIGGSSAGGNLAAALAIKVRDAGSARQPTSCAPSTGRVATSLDRPSRCRPGFGDRCRRPVIFPNHGPETRDPFRCSSPRPACVGAVEIATRFRWWPWRGAGVSPAVRAGSGWACRGGSRWRGSRGR